MLNLKNKILILFFINIFFSCKSISVFEFGSFDTKSYRNELHVLTVSSNHIVHECLFLNAESENKWRHQYMMYILNNKNEVIPVIFAINQEKSVCLEHSKRVEKILKKSSVVKICLRDSFEKDLASIDTQDFGALGKHPIKYKSLTFDSICSSKDCYSANDAWTETCPGFKKL